LGDPTLEMYVEGVQIAVMEWHVVQRSTSLYDVQKAEIVPAMRVKVGGAMMQVYLVKTNPQLSWITVTFFCDSAMTMITIMTVAIKETAMITHHTFPQKTTSGE
jgi:hypothetical protein